jgi:rRNA pseudouridine-1189 N-methylase Emg1 (Nep1/Mra1 family)
MGVKIVGTSNKAELVNVNQYVKTLGIEKKPFCFVIGAVSVGNPGMENDLVTTGENISIANVGLSAATVCGKICTAMEKLWRVL